MSATQSSLWSHTATTAGQYPSLTADLKTEVIVIGGGYLGLSTALHLGEMSSDVVLIEAHDIGWGASGRNGGQVIPGLKHDPDELDKMFGPTLGPRVVETVGGAADYVFELIHKYAIECDARQSGWIQAAHTEKALSTTLARARQWASRGANVEVRDAKTIAAMIGTNAYVGGWIDRRGGSVQPLSYARGLARAATSVGVKIYARTPALRITKHADGWQVETPHGTLSATKIVLATNGYTDKLWPGLRKTVVPVSSMQIATRPLPAELRENILPDGQVVSDTLRLLRYFHIDHTGRLLMGTRGPFKSDVNEGDAKAHITAIRALFPQIEGIELDYVWSGNIAMTADHMPHIHNLAPGVFAALGFNGRGVAMSTRLGRATAELMSGHDEETVGFPLVSLKPMLMHSLNRIGVQFLAQYYQLRDALEK